MTREESMNKRAEMMVKNVNCSETMQSGRSEGRRGVAWQGVAWSRGSSDHRRGLCNTIRRGSPDCMVTRHNDRSACQPNTVRLDSLTFELLKWTVKLRRQRRREGSTRMTCLWAAGKKTGCMTFILIVTQAAADKYLWDNWFLNVFEMSKI